MMLLPLLFYAVLVLWIEERWAWTVFQIGTFVLAGARILRGDRWTMPGPLAVLACAAAWPLLQVAAGTSVSPGQTWYAVLDWLTFLLVFALASEVRPERILRQISTFGLLLATTAILQQFSPGGRIFWIFPSGYSDSVLGPFVNRNQYSAWIELLIPIAMYLAFTDRRQRSLHGTSAAVMFSSVVAGGSRAGVALCVTEVVTTLLILKAKRPSPRKASAAWQFLPVTLFATVVATWQSVPAGMRGQGGEQLRIDAVKASFQMVRVHPWIGWGLGSWPEVYPRFAGFDTGLYLNQAHNDWSQWAAEGGLPFAALLIVFAGLLWKRAWPSIYGIGTLAFLLHALVDYPMQQRPAIAAWFFAIAGIVFHSRQLPAQDDGLLRRVRHLAHRIGSRDSGILQEAGPPGSPGPLRGPGPSAARRAPDEASQLDSDSSRRSIAATAV